MRFTAIAMWLAMLALGSESARGAEFITSTGTGGIAFNQNATLTENVIGWRITVGAEPIRLTALGTWDYQQNGLPTAMRVGVWNTSTAALLASVTAPAGTGATLVGEFRYVDLATPVILAAGQSYTFGTRLAEAGLRNVLRHHTGATTSSAATLTMFEMHNDAFGQAFDADLATQMPVNNLGGAEPLLGPNFQFTAVPEPGGLGLAIVGITGVAAGRRRRG